MSSGLLQVFVKFRNLHKISTTIIITTEQELLQVKEWSIKLLIFIIKGFRTIFIVISTTFRPICPLAFFRCLSNSGTYMELQTMFFIEFTGIACSDSISHNRIQVLSIPLLLLTCSQDWTCNY